MILDLRNPDDCIRHLAAVLPRSGPHRGTAILALTTLHIALLEAGATTVTAEQLALEVPA